MLKLTKEVAKTLIKKIKNPKIISLGNGAFEYENLDSVGLIDPHAAIGTEFPFILECPVPVIYPEVSYKENGVDGYFLYRKSELSPVSEPWLLSKSVLDPVCENQDEKIDVSDCAVCLPSDIEKLTCTSLVSSFEDLIKREPTILDCIKR